VSSGYITGKGEPGPDEIGEALREAVFENPRLREMPSEEVARQLILGGHLQEEPSPELVADMLFLWRLRRKASRPTSSPRRVIPPNDGNYFSRTCVSNTALGPLRHHSLPSLRFRRVTFSETELPVYGVLGNSTPLGWKERAGAATSRPCAPHFVRYWIDLATLMRP
jgi:hypothetical protein